MLNYDLTLLENESLTTQLVDGICHQLNSHNWSLKILSDKSDIPYETIKKLVNHKIKNPSFYSIYCIASAFGCSIEQLTGDNDPMATKVRKISDRTDRLLRILADMESILEE